MNGLQIFKNPDFGQIRVLEKDGQPWFVGKDIAEVLEYRESHKAITRHVDDEDRTKHPIPSNGGIQESWIINESGLYSLILSSELPSAKKFKKWVTSEVLPSIRKNGGYIANQENLTSEQILANAVLVAQNVIAEKDKLITEMKPKAIFADAVAVSHTSILVGDLAKILNQNGIDIGANRLFNGLREKGYLIKRRGTDWNMPTQYSMDLGLFEVKESTTNNPDGSVRINKTTKVTGKGQQYFINKFLSQGVA